MKLTITSCGDEVHLSCEGDVTHADFVNGVNPFVELLGSGCFSKRVLVNLEKAILIDTAGIGWLVMSHKSFEEGGGILILHSIPPLVDHVFRLLNMPSILHMTGNETGAQALVSGGTT